MKIIPNLPLPDALSEEDWLLTKKTISLKEALSRDFSSTHKDEEWIDRWSGQPGMTSGWFSSPKGIYIVNRPYFTAINRHHMETLCKTQEVFDRVLPAILYLFWRVTKNIASNENHPA